MTPEREAKILAVLERTQRAGLPVRPTTVWRETGGHKPGVVGYVKAWLVAHPAAEGAVAVLEAPDAVPDDAQAYAQGPACRLTDGLPEPPARPTSRDEPRLMALDRERREAHVALEAAQRRVQETSVAQQGKYTARQLTASVHEASRRARMAPAHELAAVDRARDALAALVGDGEASRVAEHLGYMPSGLQ